MTRRERALHIAEEALIKVHGDVRFWKDQDLADRQLLLRRCEADLARITPQAVLARTEAA
ncbi:hypothetical protein [Streptacidiphilus sp. EB129]|uniref:hypothetical protein n=1 Tax=Streptacidiphilus sp. EB129 TaxID=3156262 RepID=UPI003519980B